MKRHGLLRCKNGCGLWNRDTNGAINIWKIAVRAIGRKRKTRVSEMQGWDGKTVSVFDLVFVLKTVSKKPETVSYGFSIHFSSDYWYHGLTVQSLLK
jgi:hypothetical protein